MKCKQCGFENTAAAKFCCECGDDFISEHLGNIYYKNSEAAASADVVRVGFNKKSWRVYFLVLIFAIISIFGWLFFQKIAAEKAEVARVAELSALESYILSVKGRTSEISKAYKDLQLVSISDFPGYGGALNQFKVQDAIKIIKLEEENSFAKINLLTFPDNLVKCIKKMHQVQIEQLLNLNDFSTSSLVNFSEFRSKMSSVSESFSDQYLCLELLKSIQIPGSIKATTVPIKVSNNIPDNQVSSVAVQEDIIQSNPGILDRYFDLHNEKSYAEWGEDDMLVAINILANPKSPDELKSVESEGASMTNDDCSTGSCYIIHTEFIAAKLLRDGKASNATVALEMARH